MCQIVLMRPGLTEYDRCGRIQGTLDIPLTMRGREQTSAMVEALKDRKVSLIYTSPCRAAVETGALLASGLGIRSKVLDKLRNLDCGLWQGLEIDVFKRRQPRLYRQLQDHPELASPPEGETPAEAEDRIAGSLEKLCRKHRDEVIVLIVPEPLAGIVRSHMLNTELTHFWPGQTSCGSWEVFDISMPGLATVSV